MRIVNEQGKTITEFDLSAGALILFRAVKEGAQPIDNVTKFAWAEADYEDVQMYIPRREKTAAEEIRELKARLSGTDYKVIKCSECQLLGQEMPYAPVALHEERQAIRDRINQLEQEGK